MSCVIFGAGKIARGFIAHLLSISKMDFVFVEKSEALANLINERGQYHIHLLGVNDPDVLITGVHALTFSQTEEITKAIAEADVVFDAVGGKNLEELIPFYVKGIEAKAKTCKDLNFITCENWKQPAAFLQKGVEEALNPAFLPYFHEHVGFTESVVMRSGIESDAWQKEIDPLVVNMQNYWHLPVDADRIKGSLPDIYCLEPLHHFKGFLERKFYTYNAANGTVSFIGALLGHEILSDAATDPRILPILHGVYEETGKALSLKHGISFEDQMAFAGTSLAKLQAVEIRDFVERNARDPIRKLGPDDRLVGSARMVYETGILPHNLCTAIAAAIYYKSPGDPFAEKLNEKVAAEGVDAVLSDICKLDPEGPLGKLVKEKIALLKEWGWIHE